MSVKGSVRKGRLRSQQVSLVLLISIAAGALIGLRANAGLAVISQDQAKIEAELITIRRFGFEPAEIRRPAGEFVIVIDDRSQKARDLVLTLSSVRTDQPPDKLRDVDFKTGRSNWHERFNLPAGEYVLTEANNPEWRCTITLTAK